MHTWARRGIKTALVTGGLLMLGTGIASADENVDPDRPASPLDGSLKIPVHVDNNAVGTPLGSKTLPGFDRDISINAADLTKGLPSRTAAPQPQAVDLPKGAHPLLGKSVSDLLPTGDLTNALPLQGTHALAPLLGSLQTGGLTSALPLGGTNAAAGRSLPVSTPADSVAPLLGGVQSVLPQTGLAPAGKQNLPTSGLTDAVAPLLSGGAAAPKSGITDGATQPIGPVLGAVQQSIPTKAATGATAPLIGSPRQDVPASGITNSVTPALGLPKGHFNSTLPAGLGDAAGPLLGRTQSPKQDSPAAGANDAVAPLLSKVQSAEGVSSLIGRVQQAPPPVNATGAAVGPIRPDAKQDIPTAAATDKVAPLLGNVQASGLTDAAGPVLGKVQSAAPKQDVPTSSAIAAASPLTTNLADGVPTDAIPPESFAALGPVVGRVQSVAPKQDSPVSGVTDAVAPLLGQVQSAAPKQDLPVAGVTDAVAPLLGGLTSGGLTNALPGGLTDAVGPLLGKVQQTTPRQDTPVSGVTDAVAPLLGGLTSGGLTNALPGGLTNAAGPLAGGVQSAAPKQDLPVAGVTDAVAPLLGGLTSGGLTNALPGGLTDAVGPLLGKVQSTTPRQDTPVAGVTDAVAPLLGGLTSGGLTNAAGPLAGGVQSAAPKQDLPVAGVTDAVAPLLGGLTSGGLTNALPGGLTDAVGPLLGTVQSAAPKQDSALPTDLGGILPTSGIANGLPADPVGMVGSLVGKAQSLLPATSLTNALPGVGRADSLTGLPTELPLDATDTVAPLLGVVPGSAALGRQDLAQDDMFRDNNVDGAFVVPVDVSGNAVAAGGDVAVANESTQSAATHRATHVSGSRSSLAGNSVDLDWALPVQVTGNAAGAVGNAQSISTASQDAAATGDVQTDGQGGAGAGNVAAPQFATPVQLTGNAITGAGHADTDSTADTAATAGGTVVTSGKEGMATGNAGAVPLAAPVALNGNALSGVGKANAHSESSATQQAGAQRPDSFAGNSTYLETSGDPATLAGNLVQPGYAGAGVLDGNAASVFGESAASGDTTTDSAAGGGSRTWGNGSALSGSIVEAPLATPVQGFGNALGASGNSVANHDNDVDSTSGGHSITRGHDGVAAGTVLGAPVSGPVDVFCTPLSGAGKTGTECDNESANRAGGVTGTSGDDSLLSGNNGTVPVALPVEAFGASGAGVGTAKATTTGHKTAEAGGANSTADDNGTLAANLLQVPVAGPVQAYGNNAGAVANTRSQSQVTNTVKSGGDSIAAGTEGTLAGNVVQSPVALPAQTSGTGTTAFGNGQANGHNDTRSTAGGNAVTDGVHGTGTGNVVSAPLGGIGQVFGSSASALGNQRASGLGMTDSAAGGTVGTAGTDGTLAGNVVSPQALPIAQVFGQSGSIGGDDFGAASNRAHGSSGGDITTDGQRGMLSGNLFDLPVAGVPQGYSDALAVLGSASGSRDNDTTGIAGGTSRTKGDVGALSGFDGTVPVGVVGQMYNVPFDVYGSALTYASDRTMVRVAQEEPQFNYGVDGHGIAANELPVLPRYSAQRSDIRPNTMVPGLNAPTGVPFAGKLFDMATAGGGLSGVSGTQSIPPVQALAGQVQGGMAGGVPTLDSLSSQAGTGLAPALSGTPTLKGKVPAVDTLPGVGTLSPQQRSMAGPPALPKLPNTTIVPGKDTLPSTADLPSLPVLTGRMLPHVPPSNVADTQMLPMLPDLPGPEAMPMLSKAAKSLFGQYVMPSLGDTDVFPALSGLNLPKPALPLPRPQTSTDQRSMSAPALSGLDTISSFAPVGSADLASLADTQAKLQGLFGHLPSVPSLPTT